MFVLLLWWLFEFLAILIGVIVVVLIATAVIGQTSLSDLIASFVEMTF